MEQSTSYDEAGRYYFNKLSITDDAIKAKVLLQIDDLELEEFELKLAESIDEDEPGFLKEYIDRVIKSLGII